MSIDGPRHAKVPTGRPALAGERRAHPPAVVAADVLAQAMEIANTACHEAMDRTGMFKDKIEEAHCYAGSRFAGLEQKDDAEGAGPCGCPVVRRARSGPGPVQRFMLPGRPGTSARRPAVPRGFSRRKPR
ncbi:hypothetical protein ACFVH6_19685 [Spirillospora sp. NPDC127200]